MICCSIS